MTSLTRLMDTPQDPDFYEIANTYQPDDFQSYVDTVG